MSTIDATMWEHGATSAQIASSVTPVPDRVIVVNTDTGEIRIGDGTSIPSALPVIGPQTAATVPFTPAGGIGASDVQAAILEARSDAIAASAPAGSAVTTVNGEGPGAVTLSAADVSAARDRPWIFYVEDFGAVGDNVTDDSAAIRACIDAAVTYAKAHAFYAEVRFDAKTYLCNTLAQRTVTSGGQNSLLCLPDNPATAQKLTLVLKGAGAGGFLMFGQTVPYRAGTVIRTTLTGLTAQTVNGVSVPPSIIGFPRYSSGTIWSNTLIVADGLTVQAPLDPGIIGYDFLRASQMNCGSLAAIADGTQTAVLGSNPSNGLGIGFYAPDSGNNDHNTIHRLAVEGFQTGLVPAEHFYADTVALIYCQDAVFIGGSGAVQHGVTIGQLSAEGLGRHVFNVANTGGRVAIDVGRMDTELVSGDDVNDSGGTLTGRIGWHAVTRAAPQVTGGANVAIVNDRLRPGVINASSGSGTIDNIAYPAVPTTGTPLKNPYWRDATVYLTGGTVTGVAVDGVTLGVTTGPVDLPSGSTLVLTHSAPPTFAAWALR